MPKKPKPPLVTLTIPGESLSPSDRLLLECYCDNNSHVAYQGPVELRNLTEEQAASVKAFLRMVGIKGAWEMQQ